MAADVTSLEGVVPILPTPLSEGGSPDEQGLRHLVDHCVSEGLDGAVVLGSNGEFPYLDFAAKRSVMEVAADAAGGRIPVIGTASAHGTDEAIALARAAGEAGCDAVMAALPLYFDLGVEAAVAHMDAIAREGGLPVFYYHFPDVTGLALSAAEIARIAAIPGVVGAKITVTNEGFLRDVIRATSSQGWRVFTGTSFLLQACVQAGGAGVFCPLPLLAPREIRDLHVASKTGDTERASEIQAHVRRAIPVMSGIDAPAEMLVQGFEAVASAEYQGSAARSQATHALVKEALRLCGHPIEPHVRRPFVAVGESERKILVRVLTDLGWLPDGPPPSTWAD